MPSLVCNLKTTAAGADLVEDRVVAEDQRLCPALIDFLNLELRQLLAQDKLPSKFLRVFRLGLGWNEIFQLAGRKNTGILELLHELFECNGHDLLLSVFAAAASLFIELAGVESLPELGGRFGGFKRTNAQRLHARHPPEDVQAQADLPGFNGNFVQLHPCQR
jgi:hypothetical protein